MGQALFDKWSLAHVGWGFTFGYFNITGPFLWFAIHTAYEAWENSGHRSVVKTLLKHEKDSWLNIVGDTIAAMLGYALGVWMR